jgi:hypothetical protein
MNFIKGLAIVIVITIMGYLIAANYQCGYIAGCLSWAILMGIK